MTLPFFQARLLLLPLLLAAFLAAGGAPITWGPATNTEGKSQLMDGDVVLAVSGGTGATITGAGPAGNGTYVFTGVSYQNLSFTPAPGLRLTADVSNGAPSTGDANFDTLIKSLTDSNASIASGTQTINGLIPGTPYRIQIFYNDQRAGLTTRVMTFGDGGSPAKTVNLTAGGTGWGQFAVGTFTADAATQTLTHAANGFANVHFNAILLAKAPGPIAAPETPTGTTARAGDRAVLLDWNDNTQTGFANFIIRRSTTPGGPYTQIATPTASTHTDTGLTNGVTYHYVIAAANSLGQVSANGTEVSATPAATAAPPNFLLIITDDQDTHSIGAYRRSERTETASGGQPYVVDTPNMDRLAAEGMLFHGCRIMGSDSAAVCLPSRTCLMTGRNPWQRTVASAADTMPGVFNRGARTGLPDLPFATYNTNKAVNTYSLAENEFTLRNLSDKRGNTDGAGSEWHADNAIGYIEHWRANHRPFGKPFLMQLGFSHPHDIRLARTSPALTTRYGCLNTTSPGSLLINASAPPLPFNHLSCTPATYPAHPFDFGHLTVRDETAVEGVLQYRTEAVIRNEIGRHLACVDWIDRQLGRVLAKLEDPDGDGNPADSVLDNTYIVFTSDHGIAIGRHGLQGKQNLYEHTWRVPYIVRGPGIRAGSETSALVALHDTFPTFCDLAGLALPATLDGNDGRSFRAVLEGSAATHRETAYGLYAGGSKPGIRSVTDGRFKLIKYDVGANATQVTQLFDLETNPFELLPAHGVPDLASAPAYSGVRQRLEQALARQRIETADPYAFLGDRLLWRFEDGAPGQPAATLADSLPFARNALGLSGNGRGAPVFSSDVPASTDAVLGQSNTRSLDFERDNLNSLQVADARELDFGANPFTIEARVKLETLPAAANAAGTMPVVMKRAAAGPDSGIDYLFLATAGVYGGSDFSRLALVLGSTTIVSSLAIPDTGWHSISVAFDPVSDTVRFTLDQQTDVKTTTAVGTLNTGPLVIGAHLDASGAVDYAFDGLMDELSITNGFLPAAELQPLGSLPPPAELEIISHALTDSGVTITFSSSESYLYDVQRSTTLAPDSWTSLRSYLPGAPGAATTTVTNLPATPGTRCFYRILRRPPGGI